MKKNTNNKSPIGPRGSNGKNSPKSDHDSDFDKEEDRFQALQAKLLSRVSW